MEFEEVLSHVELQTGQCQDGSDKQLTGLFQFSVKAWSIEWVKEDIWKNTHDFFWWQSVNAQCGVKEGWCTGHLRRMEGRVIYGNTNLSPCVEHCVLQYVFELLNSVYILSQNLSVDILHEWTTWLCFAYHFCVSCMWHNQTDWNYSNAVGVNRVGAQVIS